MSINLSGLSNDQLAELRAYITATDGERYKSLPPGLVEVNLSHSNLKQHVVDLRLSIYMTVSDVKLKIYQRTGSSVAYQKLILKDKFGTPIAEMNDDNQLIGNYGIQSGMEIYCIDQDPFSLSKNGGLEDTSKIEKYVLSDEEYNQRKNTYRAFKREQLENKLVNVESTYSIETVKNIHIGDRCQVSPGERRGEVKWIGEYKEAKQAQKGYWVGVQFDEPVGKNNGSLNGVQYFSCPQHYGGFVRGTNVQVGDYPEEEINMDSDEDEI
ncbi:hypothetical protein WA158_008348 [Blastocystis sp. Blastoise]